MHPLVALVTLLSLLVYFWMSLRVGGARGKFGVEAPATTGHPEFERHFRVHYNTSEWLWLYLPSLWLFAIYVNDLIAAGVGVVWIVGRIIYALSYVKDPKTRSAGFGIQGLATAVLLFGSLGYVVWDLVQHGI
jgi:glutathione S-transferase